MSSRNAPSIKTLINAISGGLTAGQTTDLIRKIQEDLESVWSQVNEGPLPAVEAGDLLRLNNVAFINFANVFSEINTFSTHVLIGSGRAIYFGSVAADKLRYYGDATQAIIRMGTGGRVGIQDATGVEKVSFHPSGALAVFSPGADPGTSGLYMVSNQFIYSLNAAGLAYLKMMNLDGNNIVRLGEDAAASGVGHVAIPAKTAANLPAAAAAVDGIIVTDKTNNRFCFYHSGARYYVLGTAF